MAEGRVNWKYEAVEELILEIGNAIFVLNRHAVMAHSTDTSNQRAHSRVNSSKWLEGSSFNWLEKKHSIQKALKLDEDPVVPWDV